MGWKGRSRRRTRRRTPGGYVRFLQLVTAGTLAPTAVAVFRFAAPLGALAAAIASAATATAVLAPIGARVRFGFQDERRTRWFSAFAVLFDLLWMTSMLAPVTTLLAAVGLAFAQRLSLGAACEVGVAGAALVAGYGVLVRRRWVRRRRVEVEIDGLPRAFDGYRIVHLSDLHVGSIDRREEAMSWSRAANALDADLAVVTGDILTTGTAYHEDAADAVGALRARDGVFACLGNHDYYREDALCAKLAGRGVRVLRNEGVAISRGEETLWLAGIEDVWHGAPDLRAALRGRPDGAAVVLLAHNPDFFPRAKDAGVSLTLSGHTHAGQLAVPFLVSRATLSHFVTRWPAGLFREGAASIFVHAGLGTTGPAIRLGAAPEVVEIVLRATPSGRGRRLES